LDTSDKLFSAKKALLEEADLEPEEQLFNVEATKPPSLLLMGFLRIAAMDSEEELKSGKAALEGSVSEANEVKAKAALKELLQDRRQFLKQARANAQQAGEKGKETLVRKEVVEIVLSLLDSEEAAVDSLDSRLSEL